MEQGGVVAGRQVDKIGTAAADRTKFLGNGKPEPISEDEETYIQWLWNEGKPLEASKVYISPQGAKLVLSGALRNFDGKVEYQLRQRRAVIHVPVGGRSCKLTLPAVTI